MTEHDAFAALQAENARLAALLDSHGIEWRVPSSSESRPAPTDSSPDWEVMIERDPKPSHDGS